MKSLRLKGNILKNGLNELLFGLIVALLLFVSICPMGFAIATEENSQYLMSPPLPQVAANTPSALQQQKRQSAVKPTPPLPEAPRSIQPSNLAEQSAAATPAKTTSDVINSGVISGAAAQVPAGVIPEGKQGVSSDIEPAYTEEPLFTQDASVMPEENVPLESVLKRNNRFLEPIYLFKLFGFVALLMLGFYLAAKLVLSRSGNNQQRPIGLSGTYPDQDPANFPGSSSSILNNLIATLIGTDTRNDFLPKVLSRQRLSPGKELHVVQVQDKILVLASTASSITVIKELILESKQEESARKQEVPIAEVEIPRSVKLSGDPKIHRKYLSRKPVIHRAKKPPVVDGDLGKSEEVYLLEDYEEHFEKPAK